jgi:hypothetical protein
MSTPAKRGLIGAIKAGQAHLGWDDATYRAFWPVCATAKHHPLNVPSTSCRPCVNTCMSRVSAPVSPSRQAAKCGPFTQNDAQQN